MEKDPFFAELKALPRERGKDSLDATSVVTRHYPPGAPVADALDSLKARGFEIYPYSGRNIPSGEDWYLAQKEVPYSTGLSERLRVIVESKDGRVVKARGLIFLIGI